MFKELKLTFKKNPLYTIYLGAVLLFAFASQYLIILDEEFLVFLCFIGVVYLLMKKVGPMVAGSFDSRSNMIKREFDRLSYAQSNLVVHIWYQHRVLQDSLKDVEALSNYCVSISNRLSERKKSAFKGFICNEVTSRLENLKSVESQAVANVQNDVVSWICKI